MSLIFNPTSGVAYLETEEAAPWASSLSGAYTHFVLIGDTVSKGYAQYVWGTGYFMMANALNMYIQPNGSLTVSAGPGITSQAAAATSPSFGGGLLRLVAIRGLSRNLFGNISPYFQSVNLGTIPGSSSVQISSSALISTSSTGDNAPGARKLTLGDRQTTPGDRPFFGTMHFAGSVNRALDDNELIAILKGDIQVLDYFKHNLVELWDFQRGDESALTGLISGTTLKTLGGSNLTWDGDAPLPVSKTRGHTILGATNRSVLAPVWAYDESSGGSEVINTTSDAMVLSPIQAGLISNEILNTQAETLSLTPVSASIRDTVTVRANPAIIGLSGVRSSVRLSEAIPAKPAIIGLSGVHASVNVSGSVTISAIPAIIGLQGVSASLGITGSISIPAKPAIIGLTGVTASIRMTGIIEIPAIPATIGLYSAQAGLYSTEIISAVQTTIGLAGVTAATHMTGVIEIPAKPAIISLSGVNAAINLSGQIQIPAKAATIALGGVRASLNGNIRIGSIPAEIRLSGVPFSLAENILARPAIIGLQGVTASIRYYGPIIIASSTAIIGLRGVNARIKIGYEPDMSIEQKIWLALKARIETL